MAWKREKESYFILKGEADLIMIFSHYMCIFGEEKRGGDMGGEEELFVVTGKEYRKKRQLSMCVFFLLCLEDEEKAMTKIPWCVPSDKQKKQQCWLHFMWFPILLFLYSTPTNISSAAFPILYDLGWELNTLPLFKCHSFNSLPGWGIPYHVLSPRCCVLMRLPPLPVSLYQCWILCVSVGKWWREVGILSGKHVPQADRGGTPGFSITSIQLLLTMVKKHGMKQWYVY